MVRTYWFQIALVTIVLSGCRHGILAKRSAELCCPTDIRKTVNWKCGEDAVFCPPCRPDHAYFGHKPTCWRDWPTSGEDWRDVNCCICMTSQPDVQVNGSGTFDRLPPTSEAPVAPPASDALVEPPSSESSVEPPTSEVPVQNQNPAAYSNGPLPATSETPNGASLHPLPSVPKTPPTDPSSAIFESPVKDLLRTSLKVPRETGFGSLPLAVFESNSTAQSTPTYSGSQATHDVWFVPDDLTSLTRNLSRTDQ